MRPLWAVLLGAFITASAASAATEEQTDRDTAQPEHRERVEVVAAEPDARDVTAFATEIRGETIRNHGGDLADLLRRVPGARIRDYGGLGAYSTVSLRASTSEQVVILVDGVPQNRALGGPVDLSAIPVSQIERISVFRGFGPAALGLGGIGGLVDIRTRRQAGQPQLRFDLLAGQLGTSRAAFSSVFEVGRGRVRVDGERLSARGDFKYLDDRGTLFQQTDDLLRRRNNHDRELDAFDLGYVVDELWGGSVAISARQQEREQGVPGLGTLSSRNARWFEQHRSTAVSWSWRGTSLWRRIDVLVDGWERDARFQDRAGDLARVTDRTTRMSGGGIVGIATLRQGRQRWTWRAELRDERARVRDGELDVPDRGGADRRLAALTVEDAVQLGRWTLAPSLRWEYRDDSFVERVGLPALAVGSTSRAWSGKLGWVRQLRPGLNVRGSVGRFHRSPSLLELFGDRGAVRGNPALLAERGESMELGLSRRDPSGEQRLDWEVVGFARRARDLIRFEQVNAAVSVARNVGRADISGIEASATLYGPRGLSLDVSGTYQHAQDATPGSPQQRLAYQPDWLGRVGFAYVSGPFRGSWDATYTGENGTDLFDTPQFRIPERWLHDLQLAFSSTAGTRFAVELRNVFDRETRDVARYPLPDRTLLVRLSRTWPSPQ